MEQDQLSNLPKTILHEILSRLPEEDAARTSVLSKAWRDTWSTFPFLFFCDTKMISSIMEDHLRKRKNFLDNVKTKLLRFRKLGLCIKQFKLSVNCFDLYYLSKDVDIWLKLASESGVEMLELCQTYDPGEKEFVNDQCYILPTGVLEAKSLTKLALTSRIGVDLAFMNRSIKFFSLQTLSLEGVLLGDEDAFKLLISRCPLLEYIMMQPSSNNTVKQQQNK